MSAKYSATARLAQSVEHETLNLRVVGSSPTLGVFSFYVRFKKNNCTSAFHFYFTHDQFCYQGDQKPLRRLTVFFFFLPRNAKKKSKNQLESLSTPELRSWLLRPC